ncbi:MAG: hypothetical protein IT289_04150 [Oligoflexia bacterium]|nr:hypothetical protein [Oligoflexia bacterium]
MANLSKIKLKKILVVTLCASLAAIEDVGFAGDKAKSNEELLENFDQEFSVKMEKIQKKSDTGGSQRTVDLNNLRRILSNSAYYDERFKPLSTVIVDYRKSEDAQRSTFKVITELDLCTVVTPSDEEYRKTQQQEIEEHHKEKDRVQKDIEKEVRLKKKATERLEKLKAKCSEQQKANREAKETAERNGVPFFGMGNPIECQEAEREEDRQAAGNDSGFDYPHSPTPDFQEPKNQAMKVGTWVTCVPRADSNKKPTQAVAEESPSDSSEDDPEPADSAR